MSKNHSPFSWQADRKRTYDPPSEARVALSEAGIDGCSRMVGKLLPSTWKQETAYFPDNIDSLLSKAHKPMAALAAAALFGEHFCEETREQQLLFLDAGTLPTCQPQPCLPQLKPSSPIMVGKGFGGQKRFSLRWLLSQEILCAYGFPRKSICTSFLTEKNQAQALAATSR